MEYQLPALIWLLWDLKLLRQKHLQQVTVAFWTSLSLASLSTMYALYQVSVRQATILPSLLLARTSRCEPWESLWGSSATTPARGLSPQMFDMPVIQKNGFATRSIAKPGLRGCCKTSISS